MKSVSMSCLTPGRSVVCILNTTHRKDTSLLPIHTGHFTSPYTHDTSLLDSNERRCSAWIAFTQYVVSALYIYVFRSFMSKHCHITIHTRLQGIVSYKYLPDCRRPIQLNENKNDLANSTFCPHLISNSQEICIRFKNESSGFIRSLTFRVIKYSIIVRNIMQRYING